MTSRALVRVRSSFAQNSLYSPLSSALSPVKIITQSTHSHATAMDEKENDVSENSSEKNASFDQAVAVKEVLDETSLNVKPANVKTAFIWSAVIIIIISVLVRKFFDGTQNISLISP